MVKIVEEQAEIPVGTLATNAHGEIFRVTSIKDTTKERYPRMYHGIWVNGVDSGQHDCWFFNASAIDPDIGGSSSKNYRLWVRFDVPENKEL